MARRAAIAVIGGGISGLASAWRLAGLGHAVTLFEAEGGLGGLATTFAWRGVHLERFYHCILPTDAALLRLIDELGLTGDLVWRRTGMGFMHRKRLLPLNTPLDLLRFEPLPIVDRLRMGLMGIRARLGGSDPRLDEVRIDDWIRSLSGERALRTVWSPMLTARLGERWRDLPALWLSSRMQREKSTQREVKGCLRHGYRSLIDAFEAGLRGRGVTIRTGTAVEAIETEDVGLALRLAGGGRERYDRVVATVPLVTFQRMTRGLPLEPALASLPLDYQGVVCGAFLLERPLSPWYWMPIVESGVTCQGIVEMSNLMPPERTHGLHLVYLLNYVHRTGELFTRPDDTVLAAYTNDLDTLFPGAAATIADRFVFRAPFVEPIWPLSYRRMRPSTTVLPDRLHLVCTAQVYPRVNSWSACCDVVEEMVSTVAAGDGAAPNREGASAPR